MAVLIILLLLAAVFFLIVMAVDSRRFVIRRYSIESEKPERPVRIAFLSDMHQNEFGRDNEKLAAAVKDCHPDLVLVGGDMITSSIAAQDKGDWMRPAISLLKELAAVCPVFCANGNHEQKLLEQEEFNTQYEKYMKALSEAGAVCLHNQYAEACGIRILGLELPLETYRKGRPYILEEKEITELAGKCGEDGFTVMIAHNPKYFPVYASWGADLVLSGHVHGGLMRLGRRGVISPDFRLFPKYSGGLYSEKESRMVLSCGIGTHTLPIRIFNPGEVSVIDIVPKK